MFELVQLEQLLAIDEYETLSKAAEKLLLSQPALSRSMQRLEKELQVPLFIRQKNKIKFNENGKVALEYAKRILEDSNEMKTHLQLLEKKRHTICIGSCAPAPMWNLTPIISNIHLNRTIQSEMKPVKELIQGLLTDQYQIIITNEKFDFPNFECHEYCTEQLYLSLPPAHPLAKYKTISFKDLNGQSILIFSKIGFWFNICKEKMPDSKFLVQEDLSALDELTKSSALPSFATNLTVPRHNYENRILIPFSDPEVNVTFYILYSKTNKKYFKFLY